MGAKQNPGRWNSALFPMVYAAESLSLAMLEMLVHLDERMLGLSYVFFQVEAPMDLILKLPGKTSLPTGKTILRHHQQNGSEINGRKRCRL